MVTPILGAPPAQAAEGCPCVVVRVVGAQERTQTFTGQQVLDLLDQEGQGYTLRNDDGRESDAGTPNVTSLRALVGATGVDPDVVRFTEVLDADKTSHPLGQGDLGASEENGFQAGLMPAVQVNGAGGDLTYIRPLRNDDDVNLTSSANRNGFFQTRSSADDLEVVVHLTGSLLEPVISAREVTGDDVEANTWDLSASIPGAPSDLTYDWDLRDGTRARTAAVRHDFPDTEATYYVTLTVRSRTDSSWGRSEPYVIATHVPNPEHHKPEHHKPEHHKPEHHKPQHHKPRPDTDHRQQQDDGDDPNGLAGSNGAADGVASPDAGSEGENGGDGSGTGGAADATSDGRRDGGRGGDERTRTPAGSGDQQVSGTLLAAPMSSPESGERVAAEAAPTSSSRAVPLWVLLSAGGVGLLALGALGESPGVLRAAQRGVRGGVQRLGRRLPGRTR